MLGNSHVRFCSSGRRGDPPADCTNLTAAAITRVCYWSPALALGRIGVTLAATAAPVIAVFDPFICI
jgi:hypothetical protein